MVWTSAILSEDYERGEGEEKSIKTGKVLTTALISSRSPNGNILIRVFVLLLPSPYCSV